MIEAIFIAIFISGVVVNITHETCVKNQINQCIKLEEQKLGE